jgi:hypothetical protein
MCLVCILCLFVCVCVYASFVPVFCVFMYVLSVYFVCVCMCVCLCKYSRKQKFKTPKKSRYGQIYNQKMSKHVATVTVEGTSKRWSDRLKEM